MAMKRIFSYFSRLVVVLIAFGSILASPFMAADALAASFYNVVCGDKTVIVRVPTASADTVCGSAHQNILVKDPADTTPAADDVTVVCTDNTVHHTTAANEQSTCNYAGQSLFVSFATATGGSSSSVASPSGGTKPTFACSTDLATPGLKDVINCNAAGGPIFGLINFAINWLIGLLGAAAALAIIIAGIQYTTSQGNPEALKKAKSRITNAVTGLILLALMFVILKFLGISK
jgi:Type IV secretion system pilin